jgi:hypothetical protein
MPKEAPLPGSAPDPVLVVSCGKGLPPGLYHLADLTVPSLDKKPAPHGQSPLTQPIAELVPTAMALAQDQGCALPTGAEASFVRAGARDPYTIWVRK